MNSNLDLTIEYANKFNLYQSFTNVCHNIINNYIDERGLRIHSISSRTKDISSLWGKLINKDKQYAELNNLSDLSGIRVITFFSEDVDIIGSIIEKHFKIDEEKSIDKRKMLDPDRFGYLSLHLVCSFPDDRLKLANFSKYKGLQFEIQIRSLLQHSWAEIEHDYGYKVSREVTAEIRRHFSRLAGLLEIADSEFMIIKKAADNASDITKLISDPDNIFINKDSVKWLITQDKTVNILDEIIAALMNAALVNPDDEYIMKRTNELQYMGLVTVLEVLSELSLKAHNIIKAFEARSTHKVVTQLSRGVSLHYLTHVLIAECLDPSEAAKKMQHLGFGSYSSQLTWAVQLVQILNNNL